MEHFALPRNAVAGDLRVVNIEFGVAVAPVAVVLQEGGRELGLNHPSKKKQREAERFHSGNLPSLSFRAKSRNLITRDSSTSLRMTTDDNASECKDPGVANPAVI